MNELTTQTFTQEQIDVIKQTIAPKGTTDAELSLFLMVSQKTGLDPFSRQIYLSERRSKDVNGIWTSKKSPETTIDGFRVIAERSGLYGGQLGPFWCGSDGIWKDVWLADSFPAAAKVGVIRKDFTEPIWGIALFQEYCQYKDDKPNSMWQKMGANQLAKCAEALGLRKAFPRDLSGMYSREEMAQADAPEGSHEQQQKVALDKIKQLSSPEAKKAEENPASMTTEHSKRVKGSITFKALGSISALKKEMRALSGNDDDYYAVLKELGVHHADEIATDAAGRIAYKKLGERRQWMLRGKELRDVLTDARVKLGEDRFANILGAHGAENAEQCVGWGEDAISALLTQLKDEADSMMAELRAE